MEKILVSQLDTPLSYWLDNLHLFDNEIQQLGEKFRIPLICLNDATKVLPGKNNRVSGRSCCERERQLLENSKEFMNYFGIVYCRSETEDSRSNSLCSDVYQIGILAKLAEADESIGNVASSCVFSFLSLGRFEILEKHHLAHGKLEGTVKLINDFDPNRGKLADLDCIIRYELPKSYKISLIAHPLLRVNELILPVDPIQLSFEIIQILDLKNEDRNEILGMRSAEERLKAALSLMETDYYVCNWCLEELVFYQSNVFTARSERTGHIVYGGLFVKHVEVPVDKRPHPPDSSAVDDDDYVDGDFLCDDTTFYNDAVSFHSPNLSASSASDEVESATKCSAIPCEVASYIDPKEEFPSYSREEYRCLCGMLLGRELTKGTEKFWMIDRHAVKGLRFYRPLPSPSIEVLSEFCSCQ